MPIKHILVLFKLIKLLDIKESYIFKLLCCLTYPQVLFSEQEAILTPLINLFKAQLNMISVFVHSAWKNVNCLPCKPILFIFIWICIWQNFCHTVLVLSPRDPNLASQLEPDTINREKYFLFIPLQGIREKLPRKLLWSCSVAELE